jgi:hypothetical protein
MLGFVSASRSFVGSITAEWVKLTEAQFVLPHPLGVGAFYCLSKECPINRLQNICENKPHNCSIKEIGMWFDFDANFTDCLMPVVHFILYTSSSHISN